MEAPLRIGVIGDFNPDLNAVLGLLLQFLRLERFLRYFYISKVKCFNSSLDKLSFFTICAG